MSLTYHMGSRPGKRTTRVVQTCVVHVIRNAIRFVSYQDRKKIAKSMRAIYTAPTVEAAELALKELDTEWGRQYPGVIDVWRRAWDEFIPFLDYPAELRRVVYTTTRSNPSTSSYGKSPRPAGTSRPTSPR
jgi:transposase-like protein